MHPMPGGSLTGALITWQHSFAGNQDRPAAHVATMQPIGIFAIGGGYYVRSTAVMVFDFENNRYLIPLGLGFGKVFKLGNAIANAFIEPQFTAYHGDPDNRAFNCSWGSSFSGPRNRLANERLLPSAK